jgi:hypothetical protein
MRAVHELFVHSKRPYPTWPPTTTPLRQIHLRHPTAPLLQPERLEEYKQSALKCGAIFLEVVVGFEGFNYAGPGTLIKNYTAHMTGLDVTIHALEAAKVIVDKAQAEASGAAIKK